MSIFPQNCPQPENNYFPLQAGPYHIQYTVCFSIFLLVDEVELSPELSIYIQQPYIEMVYIFGKLVHRSRQSLYI